MHIYPNPVKDVLYLEISESNNNIEIDIIDIKGKRNKIIKYLINNTKYQIDISHLQSGVYFVILRDQETKTNANQKTHKTMKSLFVKWKHIVLLSSILVFCFASRAQQLTHQITFSTNDVEITEVNGYDMVRLVNGGFIESEENAGEPQLPLISINLLLPEGAEATSVTVTSTQKT